MYLKYHAIVIGMLIAVSLYPRQSPAQLPDNTPLAMRMSTLLATSWQARHHVLPDVKVTIRPQTHPGQALCDSPALTLSGSLLKLTGNHTMIATCGQERTFLQITVRAVATYWVAAQALHPGMAISPTDVRSVRGDISTLPADLVFTAAPVTGALPTRLIQPGQPLTAGALRHPWLIHSGDHLDLIAEGPHFRVHASGNALDNATVNDELRVRMTNGQVLTAVATAAGEARLMLR